MSDARFADGLRYRIEIPSVEGPAVMRAVLEEADARGVPVRRVSQVGDDADRRRAGRDGATRADRGSRCRCSWPARCLGYGRAVHPHSAVGAIARGTAGVEQCIAEVRRGLEHGIRSFLVGDVGALATLGSMRAAGDLPPDLVLKTSVLLRSQTEPCRVLEQSSVRPRSTSPRISRSLISATSVRPAAPLSTSTSRSPDDQGGFVRFYDVPELIRAAAPLYVKLGLRNAPNIYPAGLHLADLAVKLGRERVRRADSSCGSLPNAPRSSSRAGRREAPDLAIPTI